MIAVDTNIVLRLLLGDDPGQLASIEALMKRDLLFVSLTVMLETGWVLESRYGFARVDVATFLRTLMMLEGIVVARPLLVDWALDRYREGADLADMLHLGSAAKLEVFATFDRRMARDAGDGAPCLIETLA